MLGLTGHNPGALRDQVHFSEQESVLALLINNTEVSSVQRHVTPALLAVLMKSRLFRNSSSCIIVPIEMQKIDIIEAK